VWMLSSVAARALAPHGWIALLLVIATAAFGRVFCGWVCPLGSAIDGVRFLRGRRPGLCIGSAIRRLRRCLGLKRAYPVGRADGGGRGRRSPPANIHRQRFCFRTIAPREPTDSTGTRVGKESRTLRAARAGPPYGPFGAPGGG
jgi:hypothetical protein